MKTRVTARVPEALAAKLDAAARQRGLSRSDVVRLALQSYLIVLPEEKPTTAYERVKHLIGQATHHERDGRDPREVIRERIRKHMSRPS